MFTFEELKWHAFSEANAFYSFKVLTDNQLKQDAKRPILIVHRFKYGKTYLKTTPYTEYYVF